VRFGRKRGRPETETFALYYASDVHGSETCWRKFLGAGRFYGVQALVMGGDLTGKAIVPIERSSDGTFRASFLGEEYEYSSDVQLQELIDAVRFNGMYPWIASAAEIDRYRVSEADRDGLFDEVMLAELQRWIELADERMRDAGIDVYVMPGNDDPWICDRALESAQFVTPCDDRLVRVGNHEMISCAYSNQTPWHSPRELDEDDLYDRIRRLVDQLERPERAIFNLHVPPYDSGLDRANEIAEDLSLVIIDGRPHEIPVGSHAVRQILEEAQPLLSLHGHIHESRGATQVGRTLAINSGSEYNSGRIHGAVVKLADEVVVSHQLVVG
jgi:Icc-related predicted phosphoesterase